jgi:hypothetical protein
MGKARTPVPNRPSSQPIIKPKERKMSAKNEDHNITFTEFQELCSEAGISVDNLEVLEQDFRSGRALADVTDALITDQEEHPAAYTPGEAMEMMDAFVSMIEEADAEGKKRAGVKIAVQAIRYLAECCHDEGKN